MITPPSSKKKQLQIPKASVLFFALLIMVLGLCISGCSQHNNAPQPTEDEIQLLIQLDLAEDIGLLVLDNNVDGVETSGGMSNADKTALKHDEALYWTLSRQDYGTTAKTVDLSVRFRVITEYCEPNYENDYPEEYEVALDPLSFKADFGETYHITISGGRTSGYQARLDVS